MVKEVVFIANNEEIKRTQVNFTQANLLIATKFIKFNNKDYEVQCHKIDMDNELLAVWLKDITIGDLLKKIVS